MDELIKRALTSFKKEQILFRKIMEKTVEDDSLGVQCLEKEYSYYSQNTVRLVEEMVNGNHGALQEFYDRLNEVKDSGTILLGLKNIVQGQSFLHKSMEFSALDPVKSFALAQSVPGEYDFISYELYINYLLNNSKLDNVQKKKIIDGFTDRCSGSYALRCYFSGNKELAELFSNPELSVSEDYARTFAAQWLNKMSRVILQSAKSFNDLQVQYFMKGIDMSDLSELITLKLDFAAILVQIQKYGIHLDLGKLSQDSGMIKFIEDSKEIATNYINQKNKKKSLETNN